MSTATPTSPDMKKQVALKGSLTFRPKEDKDPSFKTGDDSANFHGLNLLFLARRLSAKCKAHPELVHFASRAEAIVETLVDNNRTAKKMAQIIVAIDGFREHYADKKSWKRKHGSMEGWEEYMETFKHMEQYEAKLKLLLKKRALAMQLMRLAGEVRRWEQKKAPRQRENSKIKIRVDAA